MDVQLTPYEEALVQLVRDQGSLAFKALIEVLNERLKEMDQLWLKEQEEVEFNVERLRAKRQGTIELKKLLKDIGRAVAQFSEPEDANGSAVQTLKMETEYGPTE